MRRFLTLVLAIPIASALLYIGALWLRLGKLTFPLDDAWIHLAFARNLALRGELSFLPGQLSAGSTSPLWNFVLAPGYYWPLGIEAWVFFIGVLLLMSAIALTYRITHRLFPERPLVSWFSALAVALEWHLNWAAFSGMETLCFIVFSLLLLDVYGAGRSSWLVGLVGGLSMVTRPEGVVLMGLIGLHGLATQGTTRPVAEAFRTLWRQWLPMGIAFLAPVIPYIVFNWTVSGLLFPNTFYAKQAEYAELFARRSALGHWLNLSLLTFVGAQLLLIPGFLYAAWLIIKEKRWEAGLLGVWWLVLPGLYAFRLPVAYQHARYEMPVIPMLIMLGVWGTARLSALLPTGMVQRVMSRVWVLTFALLMLSFWGIGARALADDAEAIDCLVVQTAQWLSANSQPRELIAVHDIGAVGYYLQANPLLDVAGLITPDVIPFIRDESRLLQFLQARQARYLMTSADWHPQIIRDPRVQRIYLQACPAARRAGAAEMGVYRIDSLR